MRNVPVDFERLALSELDAAKEAATEEERRARLNQAAIYATEGERARRVVDDLSGPEQPKGMSSGPSCGRLGNVRSRVADSTHGRQA